MAGVQKYKSCTYGGVRGQLTEKDAALVVVNALWDMHLHEGRNPEDKHLRRVLGKNVFIVGCQKTR